jgi:hypothetical protein
MERTLRGLGIDNAKQIFHVVGTDDTATIVLRKHRPQGCIHALYGSAVPCRLGWKPVGVPNIWRGAPASMGIL